MTTKSLIKRARVTHTSLAIAVKLLLDGPCTAQEISDETGLHKSTVYELLRSLRKAKAAHISAWEPDSMGRDQIAVFSLGPGRDVRRRALTRAQIAKNYRDRKRLKLLELGRA